MNTAIRTYQDLTAWQKAMALVKDIYQATQSWPREELYGLTNQVRRAAVSVPANIAEGKGRIGSQELLHPATALTGRSAPHLAASASLQARLPKPRRCS